MRSPGGTSGPSSERSIRPTKASSGGRRSRSPRGAPRKRRVSHSSMSLGEAAAVPSAGGGFDPGSGLPGSCKSGHLDLRCRDVAQGVPSGHGLVRSAAVELGIRCVSVSGRGGRPRRARRSRSVWGTDRRIALRGRRQDGPRSRSVDDRPARPLALRMAWPVTLGLRAERLRLSSSAIAATAVLLPQAGCSGERDCAPDHALCSPTTCGGDPSAARGDLRVPMNAMTTSALSVSVWTP